MFSNLTCITLKTRFEIDVVAQTISNLVSITVDPIHDLQSLSYNKNKKKKKIEKILVKFESEVSS